MAVTRQQSKKLSEALSEYQRAVITEQESPLTNPAIKVLDKYISGCISNFRAKYWRWIPSPEDCSQHIKLILIKSARKGILYDSSRPASPWLSTIIRRCLLSMVVAARLKMRSVDGQLTQSMTQDDNSDLDLRSGTYAESVLAKPRKDRLEQREILTKYLDLLREQVSTFEYYCYIKVAKDLVYADKQQQNYLALSHNSSYEDIAEQWTKYQHKDAKQQSRSVSSTVTCKSVDNALQRIRRRLCDHAKLAGVTRDTPAQEALLKFVKFWEEIKRIERHKLLIATSQGNSKGVN
jgi:hypothetical protein